VLSGVGGPESSLRNLGWLFLPAARGGELRVAADPGERQVLADAGLERLVTVFGSLAEALPNLSRPWNQGCPGWLPPSLRGSSPVKVRWWKDGERWLS
jgi:hypothetical protein